MGTGPGGHCGRSLALAFATAGLIATASPTTASASYAHTVVEGETLSGIAAANGIATESLAAYNGISAETLVITGTVVVIPSASEAGTAAGTSGAGHVVATGETLSGIAAANGITTEALAAANGISVDALLIAGTTIQVPGATGSTTPAAPAAAPATAPTSWVAPVYSPYGTTYLASNAAAAWNSMRDAALTQYGVDLYPAGLLSAYRTYEQQAYLYDLYLSGQGAPANPPGTSSHESGTAVDLETYEQRSVIDQIGAAYGWAKVHGPDEWWHVDYIGG